MIDSWILYNKINYDVHIPKTNKHHAIVIAFHKTDDWKTNSWIDNVREISNKTRLVASRCRARALSRDVNGKKMVRATIWSVRQITLRFPTLLRFFNRDDCTCATIYSCFTVHLIVAVPESWRKKSRLDLHIESSSPPCRRRYALCNPSRPPADSRRNSHRPRTRQRLEARRVAHW